MMNFQEFGEKNRRRSELVLALKKLFEELKIKCNLLPKTFICINRKLQAGPPNNYTTLCLKDDSMRKIMKYESPDPVTGTRNRSFTGVILGRKHAWICGFLQYVSFYGTAVAYVVTTLTYMRAILKANCYHKEWRDGDCEYGGNTCMLLFGVV
ncbi:hypothetical protein HanRHA438_Chr06g0287591 [Helianthus annuus]|uniref:Uncharacterized protein n=1 Tax=Helianthus annuus TaxID=4232 RepID=A0A9K3IWC8_HELAN|nr:hypothetical protein HanXRQr2_Chr06g0278481 [Helianthus annuus]KAJ0561917.1 hypothetical protein HanHA300_Chr06g0228431 [Helianthus annuus]KAJ0574983.1 hypothetical protein HanHA89_Chr06g0244391 [Helianthus annuus]KAJ0739313.1 hypothetical protein HanLR1_Chr06g0228441 [Helianthus annuus]KAJ0913616.1 hypothetical protein HanRHA438_Chr06g0287591 [Helianthus annuus]